MPNLPISIPKKNLSTGPSIGNSKPLVSTSSGVTGQLGITRPGENAKVSVSSTGSDKRITSIHQLGESGQASVSVASNPHAKRFIGDDNYVDEYSEQAEERRYSSVKRLIRERKKKEHAAAVAAGKITKETGSSAGSGLPSSAHTELKLKTGAGFKISGVSGIKRQLSRMRLKNRATFKNVSKENMEYLEGLISDRAKLKRTGQGFTRKDRVAMKKKVWKDYKKGDSGLTRDDWKDFRKIVDSL